MSIQRYFERLQAMDSLIRKKCTGNLDEFSSRMRMSKSMLKIYIREMKELGFPIEYCKTRRTYHYDEDGRMVKNLFIRTINDTELKTIKGGSVNQFDSNICLGIFLRANYISSSGGTFVVDIS